MIGERRKSNILYAEIGDVKQGLQTSDHGGWIKLDGRAKSTLTASQQTEATGLGIGTNLPNAQDSFLVQNGQTLGSIAGSSSKTILQANLPNISFPAAVTNSSGSHTHTASTANAGGHTHTLWHSNQLSEQQGYAAYGFRAVWSTDRRVVLGGDAVNPVSDHTHTVTVDSVSDHTHSVTVSSGGSGTALDVTPKSLSVNMFLYLGD